MAIEERVAEVEGAGGRRHVLMTEEVAAKFGALADPWLHRSASMSCATCMWYVRKVPQAAPSTAPELGRCRRHAPTMAGYPVVFPSDWCGDHKLDETKV